MNRYFTLLLLSLAFIANAQVDFQLSNIQIDSVLYPDINGLQDIDYKSFGDFDGDGDADLIIYGSKTNGMLPVSKQLWLLENQGGALFSIKPNSIPYIIGAPPLVVDFNNDGLLDILCFKGSTSNGSTLQNIVLINQGNFNFQVSILNGLSSWAVDQVKSLDANNDGFPDLLLNGSKNSGQTGYTSIFINDTLGNIYSTERHLGVYQNTGIGVLDRNQDGYDDVVFSGFDTNLNAANDYRQNNTNGGFSNTSFGTLNFWNRSRIFVADFDQDFSPDFAVSNGNGSYKLDLYVNNNPLSGFTYNTSIIGITPGFVQDWEHLIIDIDADGTFEIIAQSDAFGQLTHYYYERGINGNFQVKPNTDIGDIENISGYEIIDINGDGYDDIYDPYSADLFYNNQNGSFIKPKQYQTFSGYSREFRVLDFNGDGFDDFLLSTSAENTSGLYLNINGNFFERQNIPFFDASNIKSIAAIDIDGDGDLDFVGRRSGVFVLKNDGNGQYTSQTNSIVGTNREIFILNFDNQHQLDIMIIEWVNYELELKFYTSDANGNFSLASTSGLPNVDVSSTITVGDVNKDGLDDVYFGYPASGVQDYGTYYNGPNGVFTKRTFFGSGFLQSRLGDAYIVDMDGDSSLEMISSGFRFPSSSDGFKMFHYDTNIPNLTVDPDVRTSSYSKFDVGDLNYDGRLDGVVYSTQTDDLFYFLYLANGDLVKFPIDSGEYGTDGVHFIDFDGDGDKDVLFLGSFDFENFSRFYENTAACNSGIIQDTAYACNGSLNWRGGVTYSNDTSGVIYYDIDSAGCHIGYELHLFRRNYQTGISYYGTDTLVADESGIKYQWLNCDNAWAPIAGATSRHFGPATGGNYAVELRYGGCIDTSGCLLVQGVGFQELSHHEWQLFPNPAKDQIDLEILGRYESAKIEIYNQSGTLLIKEELSIDSEYQIDISVLSSGLYIFILELDGNRHKEKLLVR